MDKEMLINLSAAVSNGRTDIVRTLVNLYETRMKEGGSDVSCEKVLSLPCNSFGTLLHLATKLDHVDIVRTLLCSGADPNIQNTLGETPFDLVQSQNMTTAYVDELLKCSAKSEVERICKLVNAGLDVNAPDSPQSGNRALHWAVCFGRSEAVQCLLDLGAVPNVVNGQGATPLHEAVKRKNTEILRILLASGADPTTKSTSGKYSGKTPLDLAEDNSPVSALLLEYLPIHHLEEKEKNTTLDGSVSEMVEKELSASLQSLSTSSEPSVRPSCVPQPSFAPLPLITDSKLHLLWPQPQKIVQTDGPPFRLEERHSVCIVQGSLNSSCVLKVWRRFLDNFKPPHTTEFVIEEMVGAQSVPCGDVLFHVSADLFDKQESYRVVVNSEQIRILASDVLGAHYALCTLGQLLCLYGEDGELPPLFIQDWPQLHHRAVLLDLSVDVRKPTMETLKGLIQTMSLLKLKQLHCYFRYDVLLSDPNFPYPNKEMIELLDLCLQHYVEVVPSIDVHTHTTLSEIKSTLAQPIHRLVTLFSSRVLELGPNLSKLLLHEMAASDSPSFLGEVFALPASLSTVFVCCSGFAQSAEILRLIPVNCVLVDYAYQVDYDYDFNAKFYSEAGFNVCIGTGTKTWGSIAGIPESGVSLVHKASLSVNRSHGLIVADWKTLPHHPALCFSWPGILMALGMAWNCNVHQDYLRTRLSELLNLYVYRDASSMAGYLTVELGRLETFVHQSVAPPRQEDPCHTSVLHQLLRDPDAVLLDNFTQEVLQQAYRHLKRFEMELQKSDPLCHQHGEVVSELRLAIDLLLFACRLGRVMVSTGMNPSGSHACGLAVINVGVGNLPPIARTDLANRLLALTEQYRAVWLSRNLPCGLQTSLRLFYALLRKLIPENEHSLYALNGGLGLEAFLLPPTTL